MPIKVTVEYEPDPGESLTDDEMHEKALRGLACIMTGLQLIEIVSGDSPDKLMNKPTQRPPRPANVNDVQ